MKKTRLRAVPALVGVIASVVALAAGPALAGGIPIRKCTTIDKPGSYVLTRNLTAVGDCLVVEADFVTIDLGGWVITGPGEGATGVGGQGQGIVVRKGTVTNFEGGVGLGDGAVVEQVRGFNTFGIGAGAGSIVSGNTTVTGSGVGISTGPSSTVSGNTVRGDDPGIIAGPGNTVSGNTYVGPVGFFVGPGSTVSGNTLLSDDGGGLGIGVNCPSNVIGNTATGFEVNLRLDGEGCTNIDNLAP